MGLFSEFFGDDWREKIVTHRTPTGRMNRVKVKSLPPEEQLKYNPNRFKRGKKDTRMTKGEFEKAQTGSEKKARTFDVYVPTKDLDFLDKMQEGELVLATNDSGVVMDLFDDDADIVKITGLPVSSIKKYLDVNLDDDDVNLTNTDFVTDKSFKDVSTDDEEKLYELAEFSDNHVFLLDLFPYVDVIDISIDKADDDSDDFEELKKESFDIFKGVSLTEEEEF